jgi:cold shock CspA family protein
MVETWWASLSVVEDNMMLKGTLKRWNDGQGFGFLQTVGTSEDIFIHISALKYLTRRPVAGDTVIFSLEADDKGRKRAVNANIVGMESIFVSREIENRTVQLNRKPPFNKISSTRKRPHTPFKERGFPSFISLFFLLSVVLFGYKSYSEKAFNTSIPAAVEAIFQSVKVKPRKLDVSPFKCEGKTRCPQMTSCEEAMFYLNHCPGTITDGDHDGLPCEDQWCGH